MHRILFACLLALSPAIARAHPGSGIVVDRAGNVYFVVLGASTIMKRAPDGTLSKFVNDSRLRFPHHLVMMADGTLFVASDHDGVVWRVGTDGSLTEHLRSDRVRGPRAATPIVVGAVGDPFTVDAGGNVYALAMPMHSSIVRINQGGDLTTMAPTPELSDAHFSAMAVGPDGALYVTDRERVWRVTTDSAHVVVASGLTRGVGIAFDGKGNLLVADHGGGRIARFAPDGVDNTPASFARLRVRRPTGVTVADDDVYVLDNPTGVTAIWRLTGERATRLYVRREPIVYARWLLVALPVLLIALLVERAVNNRRATIARASSPPAPGEA